ncbi:hypothetical protein GCM10027446_11160 [Angustibacter peucedani]
MPRPRASAPGATASGPASAGTWDADVADLLSEGVIVHGADGRVERVNRAAAELLADHDLLGRQGFDVWAGTLGPQGRPVTELENPLRVALATGQPSERVVGVKVGGEIRWLTVRAVPLAQDGATTGEPTDDDPGAPRGVAMVLVRPHDDAAAQAAVRDRDHLLSVAQRMARLSVWRYTIGAEGVEWLDGDGRGMGIAGESKTMQDYFDGIHPDDRPAHDAMLTSLLSGQGQAEVDIRYRWEEGWRHWHMWAESVVGADGSITGLWGTTQEVTDRREAEAAVRRLSMTDSLTLLANRAQAEERVHEALGHRHGQDGAGLLLVDVDRFHAVNDRHGHPVGDALLVEIGRRLAGVDRPGATAVRMGGDEFGLVIERTSTHDAATIAHQLHHELSAPYVLPGAAEPVTPSFSIGVTVVDTGAAVTASDVFRQADLSAAAAKAAGGDRVVLFDNELRARTVTRHEMEQRLRLALGDNTVLPLFQPIISLGVSSLSDRVVGCEALARINVGGRTIPPVEFVGIAEESGLIVDLDLAVFGQAVRQVLPAVPTPGFEIAVNLSPLSLQVPGLVDRISATLAATPVVSGDLRFEITEGSLAEPTPTLVENLRGLRDLGGKIGLDDFGTGYSALSYLRRFDLDFMKIDRAFVADVCSDRRSAAVVKAVIELAHAHDLTVVAEGIETADQLEALRHMQCDMVQGFHLGRPMPVDDLARRALV